MSTLAYLFGAFALAWLAVFAYLWLLARRAAAIEAQLERLERRLVVTKRPATGQQ